MCTPRCGSVCGCDCCCRRTPWPRPTFHVHDQTMGKGARGWQAGRGGQRGSLTLGQCSRHLSLAGLCLPCLPRWLDCYLFCCTSVCLSVCLSISLSVGLSVCLFVPLSAGLFIRMYFAIAQCDAMRFASPNLCAAQHFTPAWLPPLGAALCLFSYTPCVRVCACVCALQAKCFLASCGAVRSSSFSFSCSQ